MSVRFVTESSKRCLPQRIQPSHLLSGRRCASSLAVILHRVAGKLQFVAGSNRPGATWQLEFSLRLRGGAAPIGRPYSGWSSTLKSNLTSPPPALVTVTVTP